MSKSIKVLSIDGGGIRGIIPAMILAEIEKRTKKRISKLFNLIAGTSTGGILALALTKPNTAGRPEYTAERLITLYQEEGERIFSRSVWHKIRTIGGITDEKYPAAGIKEVLEEYFGETPLSQALTNVIITSYEIERRFSFFFRSKRAKKDSTYDFPMKQVARATSAAPTYFEPLKLETDGTSDYYALIDGGVFANNPAMCGYVEAKTIYPEKENDFLVVSLGTGELTRRLQYEEAKDWGLVEWAKPILSVIFDGVNDTVDYQLKQLLPSDRYYRFQTTLYMGNDDMDDASQTNIRALKILAEDIIRDNNARLDALCEQLVEP